MAEKKRDNNRKEIAKKLDFEVGSRLENIRKGKLHMTQEQLGEVINRSVPTIRRYENGLSRIPDEIKLLYGQKDYDSLERYSAYLQHKEIHTGSTI